MLPDDARHGSEAGHEQHLRDKEDACDACIDADLKASRRRTKLKTMGAQFLVPLGGLYDELQALRDRGAVVDDIAEWANISDSQVWRALNNGPEGKIYARTYRALRDMRPGPILTPVGAQRRVRALMWLGYSAAVIADDAGLHADTIKNLAKRLPRSLHKSVKAAIADTFDRLSMTPAPTEERYQRASATRTRNYARENGWLPPLAWDDIDDVNGRPTVGRERMNYRSEELLAEYNHLTGLGVSREQVAEQLGVSMRTIEKALERAAKAVA
jgi:hypothetical protein